MSGNRTALWIVGILAAVGAAIYFLPEEQEEEKPKQPATAVGGAIAPSITITGPYPATRAPVDDGNDIVYAGGNPNFDFTSGEPSGFNLDGSPRSASETIRASDAPDDDVVILPGGWDVPPQNTAPPPRPIHDNYSQPFPIRTIDPSTGEISDLRDAISDAFKNPAFL